MSKDLDGRVPLLTSAADGFRLDRWALVALAEVACGGQSRSTKLCGLGRADGKRRGKASPRGRWIETGHARFIVQFVVHQRQGRSQRSLSSA